MTSASPQVLDAVRAEHLRTVRQIKSLRGAIDSIVESSELISTDDEHDPEGATIAYERAQAIALLRQARADLHRLDDVQRRLEAGGPVSCSACGRHIGDERLAALPTAQLCIRCAA